MKFRRELILSFFMEGFFKFHIFAEVQKNQELGAMFTTNDLGHVICYIKHS